ncbi:ribonuclease inhibitor-like [Tachysurus fulvidraco]|uniref:ribonuclease inhibitor-like n=1 Tax=Tachysurus fulvidraco TaxID=1234273 RepID=UPI001FEE0E8F|nr:ribonuclease inhibitor-like [Tachysurus fulvidraco]
MAVYPDINVYRIREINSDKVRVVHRNLLLSVDFLPVDEHQESDQNDDVNVEIDLQENKVDRDDRTANWILSNTDGFDEGDECTNCTDLPDMSDCVSERLDSASTDTGNRQDRTDAKVTSDVNVTSDVDLPDVGGQDSNSTQVKDEESVVCTQPRQQLSVGLVSEYRGGMKMLDVKVLGWVVVTCGLRSISCDSLGVKSWSPLFSALRSETSNLRELHLTVKTLDLSEYKLGDSEVKSLCAVLENPHCKVETLDVQVEIFICGFCHNYLFNKSDNILVIVIKGFICVDEECVIVSLYRLYDCGVSDEGCAALTSALRSNPSHLRHLDLSENKLGDSGVKILSAVLENPHCKLETLELCVCGVSDEGCAALTSALRSNPSHLRELDLSCNKLGDSGVKSLSAVLENPHCKLETLKLRMCGVSDEGCAALTSALRSNPSHLRYLDLSYNKLGDSGVKSLSAVLENPHCKLETLRLYDCGVSDEGCAALTSALRSNPSHLRHLNLSDNKLGDSVKKLLSDLKDDEHYKLQTVE